MDEAFYQDTMSVAESRQGVDICMHWPEGLKASALVLVVMTLAHRLMLPTVAVSGVLLTVIVTAVMTPVVKLLHKLQ